MSLTELLELGPPKPKYPKNKVITQVETLPGEQQAAFRALIRDTKFTAPVIASALQELGLEVTGQQIVHLRARIKEGRVALEPN